MYQYEIVWSIDTSKHLATNNPDLHPW